MIILNEKASAILFAVIIFVPQCESDYMLLPSDELEKLGAIVDSFVKFPADYDVKDGDTFEYVVAGAGAGGIAVASRLALAGKSVLLLEAGGHGLPHAYVPAAANALMGSSIDWQYDTRPNHKSCLGSDGSQCRWSRGKALGGSTTINYMMYVRGNRKDYDLGIPGWTWRDLKPYFLRYEGLRHKSLRSLSHNSVHYHNTSGTMGVGFCADPKNTWHDRIVEGFQDLGFKFNPDVNAKSQIGISRVVTYTKNGLRESTATGYLLREDVQKSLHISTKTRVARVLFDENNTARAITAIKGISGREITVHASKGVILSAGTIGTPQILQLSGIGPRSVLNKLNIPVKIDLPVGENVYDHVLPLLFVRVDSIILEVLRYAPAALEYGISRDGKLASIGLTDITALVNTSCYDANTRVLLEGPGCEFATLQSIHAYIERGALIAGVPIFKKATHLNDDILAQIVKENTEGGIIVISPVVLTPYSRGYVRINSTDPHKQPEIYPNYLGDDRDVDEMLRSIKIIEHLVETHKFSERNAKIIHLKLKGCPSYESDKEGYWRCYVRHLTFSVFHAAGSCSLGKVLDPKLGVRGVKNTFVADLSAMPNVPKGNTAAISIALGERLADFLREDDDDGDDDHDSDNDYDNDLNTFNNLMKIL